MRAVVRNSLGILIAIQLLATLSSAAEPMGRRIPPVAQAGARTACSIIDPEAVRKLTGRQDYLKRGPINDDPATPGKGKSACGYVGFSFELAVPAEAGSFEKNKSFLEKGGAKTDPVSGVGDAAFYWWDPKPGTVRPVGIVLRAGTSTLMIMDMTTPDSIPIVKPQLLAVAKSLVPKLR